MDLRSSSVSLRLSGPSVSKPYVHYDGIEKPTEVLSRIGFDGAY